jgi:chemotaxis protein histidine kinase CheA
MFRTKNAIRVVATASALATGLMGPGRAAPDQGGLPEVRRDLQQEVADRKAADVALAKATQAALETLGAVLTKAIADGDASTAAAARAADEALRKYLEAAISNQAAATAAAAQAANDKLEAVLRQVMAAGDAATLAEGKAHTDGRVDQLKIEIKAYADAKSEWNKAYTDTKTDEAKADATDKTEKAKKESKDYADWKSEWNKKYTEDKTDEAKALAEAKVDQAKREAEADAGLKADQAKQEAKTHADDKAAQSKTEAKNESTSESKVYTDTKVLQTKNESLSEAKTYTDAKLDESKAYADSVVSGVLPRCEKGETVVHDGSHWVCAVTTGVHMKRGPYVGLVSLDGEFGAWVESVQTTLGSDAIAETAIGNSIHKHVGPINVPEMTITLNPFNASSSFQTWMKQMLLGNPQRKNGALFLMSDSTVTGKVEFLNATVTEVDFPAMDNRASTGQSCALTVKIQPETTRLRDVPFPTSFPNPAAWTGCHFAVEMAGMVTPAARVEALKVTRPLPPGVGELRDYVPNATPTVFSDLVFSLLVDGAESWTTWFNDFVLGGNNADDQEKTGDLILLSPGGAELGRLKMSHMGVFNLGLAGETPGYYDVGVYMEAMEFVPLVFGMP